MSVRRVLYLQSSNLKGLFFVVIVFCILGIVIYTVDLVNELRKDTRDIAQQYAQIYLHMATKTADAESMNLFFEIVQKATIPLVQTDENHKPISWKNLSVPESANSPEDSAKVKRIMRKLADSNTPLEIKHKDQVLHYLYYGDSKLITQLVSLPYITLSGFGLLFLVAFLGFDSIKTSEQRFIWVGMAKETAHQLGTPISSLLGWLEILKSNNVKADCIVNDMESDVKRLEKIAARFSRIGSKADLKRQPIEPIFHDIITYFNRRLPQSGKQIEIIDSINSVPLIPLNRELFEWAIENLIKNAIDAVKNEKGRIEIKAGQLGANSQVYIDIGDNGIGIKANEKRHIFKAGYSTKKRGWGLGLNFTKRIIEDYHHGKIFIRESHVGKGTIMRIVLVSK